MNLEPTIQSEVSQKEKNAAHSHTCVGSGKTVLMGLSAGSSGDAGPESRLVDAGGEGEGGAHGERSTETHTSENASRGDVWQNQCSAAK